MHKLNLTHFLSSRIATATPLAHEADRDQFLLKLSPPALRAVMQQALPAPVFVAPMAQAIAAGSTSVGGDDPNRMNRMYQTARLSIELLILFRSLSRVA